MGLSDEPRPKKENSILVKPTLKESIDDLKVNISMQIIKILEKVSIINSSEKIMETVSPELTAFDYDAFVARTLDKFHL